MEEMRLIPSGQHGGELFQRRNPCTSIAPSACSKTKSVHADTLMPSHRRYSEGQVRKLDVSTTLGASHDSEKARKFDIERV
jgi:hypothetical protein